ncbi:FMRFamide receptor-like [Dreissena polymorpha]|uniref:FMRFamide receptor-like n=1 Tax=Dreissena polymorpha TaxID=45954 RepID=UPI00226519DB|nr:FMRFamide receptor-like [Dreissena polymorpha]
MPVSELNLKVNISVGNEYLQDNGQTQLMFVFWGIIIPIIGVIGFIGNLLTIIVLFRIEMKSTTMYFLRVLVVTDTGIIIGCILGLSIISITQLYPQNPEMHYFTHVIYPYMYTPVNYIVMTLQFINVWVTVAVSIERYIAICHPFKAVHVCNKRNAFILIGLVAQFWFLGQNVLTKWICVSNTLFELNSSVNFLIYTAVGRKFRKLPPSMVMFALWLVVLFTMMFHFLSLASILSESSLLLGQQFLVITFQSIEENVKHDFVGMIYEADGVRETSHTTQHNKQQEQYQLDQG